MLLQMHWQYTSFATEMKAEKEINDHNELRKWAKEIDKKFPLAIPGKGARWVFVTEHSPLFVKTVADAKSAGSNKH